MFLVDSFFSFFLGGGGGLFYCNFKGNLRDSALA